MVERLTKINDTGQLQISSPAVDNLLTIVSSQRERFRQHVHRLEMVS
jgi:hypothetical protein